MSGRYIIEGEWSGYRSGQERVVHRTVHRAAEKRLRAWVESTHAIHFSDGTRLVLSARDCKPRERVEEISGYRTLIRDCAYREVNSVEALRHAEAALKSARSPGASA